MLSVGEVRATSIERLRLLSEGMREYAFKANLWKEVIAESSYFPSWEGRAADNARLAFNRKTNELEDLADRIKLASLGLEEFIAGFSRVFKEFEDFETEVADNGYVISDDNEIIDTITIEVDNEELIDSRRELLKDYTRKLEVILLLFTDVDFDAKRVFTDVLEGRVTDDIKQLKYQARSDALEIPLEYRGDPKLVKVWWDGLTKENQQRLIHEHPEQIANLDGVPFTGARSEACLRYLPKARKELEKQLKQKPHDYYLQNKLKEVNWLERSLISYLQTDFPVDMANVKKVEEIYNNPKLLADYNSGKSLNLVTLDTKGSRRELLAATAWGDLDKADHVSVKVGGVGTNVLDSTDEMIANSKLSQRETLDILHRIPGGKFKDETVATVAWMGYEAPEKIDPRTMFAQTAYTGADKLQGFLTGVDEVNTPEHRADSHVTLVGHSYGSTTADKAAQLTTPGVVDNLVLQGSPGVTSHADNLNVPEANRFLEDAPSDKIPGTNKPEKVIVEGISGLVGVFADDDHWIGLGDNPEDRDDFTQLETQTVAPDDGRLDGKVAAYYKNNDGLYQAYGHSEYDRPVGDVSPEDTTRMRTSVYNTSAIIAGHPKQLIKPKEQ